MSSDANPTTAQQYRFKYQITTMLLYIGRRLLTVRCDTSLSAGGGRIAKFLGNYGTPIITPGGFVFDLTAQKTTCNDEFYMVVNSGSVDYRSLGEFMAELIQK